jgi:hypothetical protein
MAKPQITTEEEFQNWAKRVNLCGNPGETADLQDEFARSDMNTLKDIFRNTKNLRFLSFGIFKNQSDDTFWEFIRTRALHIAHTQIELDYKDVAEREGALNQEQIRWRECRRGYYRKLMEAQNERDRLRQLIAQRNQDDHWRIDQLRKCKEELRQYKEKARKYDLLKSALEDK